MKVRHYGFMGSGCHIPHGEVAAMAALADSEASLADSEASLVAPSGPHAEEGPPPLRCPRCGGALRLEQVWKPGVPVTAPPMKRLQVTVVQLE